MMKSTKASCTDLTQKQPRAEKIPFFHNKTGVEDAEKNDP